MSQKPAYKAVSRLGIREQGEGTFLLYHDERGYETNAVGIEIVQFCQDEKTFVEICQRICEIFDAPMAQIEQDVQEVIDQFVQIRVMTERTQNGG